MANAEKPRQVNLVAIPLETKMNSDHGFEISLWTCQDDVSRVRLEGVLMTEHYLGHAQGGKNMKCI